MLVLSESPLNPAEPLITQPVDIRCALVADPAKPGDEPDWMAERLTSDLDYRDTTALLGRLQTIDVEGEPLWKLAEFEGASMWQFLPSYIWPAVFRAVEWAKAVQQGVDEHTPTALQPLTLNGPHGEMWLAVVRSVARHRGLEVVEPPPQRRAPPRPPVRRLALEIKRRVARMSARIARDRSPKPARRTAMLVSFARHWRSDPFVPGSMHDEQISRIATVLGARGFDHVAVDCPYESEWSAMSSLRARRRDGELDWIAFYRYGTGGPLAAVRARRSFSRLWERLASSEEFRTAVQWNRVALWPALETTFSNAVRRLAPECVQMRSAAARMLDRERPAVVLASYESGPFQRALLIEADTRKIPSVGLMHGMIFANHYDYMGAHVKPRADAVNTIPTVTAVWGEAWAKRLTEVGHYPASATAVTGNWRYDEFERYRDRFDRDAARARFDVGPDDVMVLAASSRIDLGNYLAACVEAARSVPRAVLVVRPHPGDNPRHLARILGDLGLTGGAIATEPPLIELLMAADVVVAQPSTAIAEATLAQVPCIITSQGENTGWEEFEDTGIAIPARGADEIHAAIVDLVTDSPARAAMLEAHRRFAASHFGPIDGGAADRVADVVDRLVADPSGG